MPGTMEGKALKITVDQAALADAAAWCQRAIGPKPGTPVMAGMFLTARDGTLTLAGFDYDMAATASIPVTAGGDGAVLLPGRLLTEITRSLPARPVMIMLDGGSRVAIECGSAKFSLPAMPLADYPGLPPMPAEAGTIGSAVFADAAGQVAVAASKDDSLPALTAVRIELAGTSLILAATDRYRLAVADVPGWEGTGFAEDDAAMIPAGALLAAAKAMTGGDVVTVAVGDGLAGFAGGGKTMVCRQIAGEFPKYGNLIPGEFAAEGTVSGAILAGAVRRVALACERNMPVRFTFTPCEVTLRAGTGAESTAEETLPCGWDAEETAVALNPRYLLDGLTALGDETVRFGFNGPAKPVLLTAAGEGFRYVIVPVRPA
jgi:DNA polymerase-3 subunit beta